MEEKTTFGRFLTKKRKERNLTQRELAEKLFVTESAVSKWERGVSYPDISLVSQICEILKISEHELITASEDLEQRKIEAQAHNYRNLIRGYSAVMLVGYAVSLIACFIVNLVLEHRLSWFFLVLTGELVAFSLLSLPLLIHKKKGLITLCSFYLSLTLLLYTCALYTGGDWFGLTFLSVTFGFLIIFLPYVLWEAGLPPALWHHKALLCMGVDTVFLFALLAAAMWYAGAFSEFFTMGCPIAAVSILYPWALLGIIRYVKAHPFFRAALALGFSGIYTFLVNHMIHFFISGGPFLYRPIDLMNWREEYINGNITLLLFIVCMALAFAFAVGGILLTVRKRAEDEKGAERNEGC